ncbi:MAG: TonB-dependent receptor plug domain-containing protein [Bacteroidales bacterium]|nr:TonB-dependent receptor plug domain-containing protein [Bacteroidales bacterium]
MNKILFVFVFIFVFLTGFSQNVTISGYVSDAISTENLINATVRINNTKNAVFTNQFGFYSLIVPSNDSVTITVSYIGCKTIIKTVFLSSDTELNFLMYQSNNIDSIIITAQKGITNTTETGVHQIYTNQIKLLPSLGGETDILKAIQLLPGVQSGNEGSNGFYVRGGNTDENLILLDDVPLYNVNHVGGFVSVFNSDAINSAKIIKSGFPAKYGGRLSSVLDVRMKDGNMHKISGNFNFSPISSNLSINGPLKKDKTAFMFSVRALYLGIIVQPLTFLSFNGYSQGYNFYDINFKLVHKINSNNRLFLSFYQGGDNYIYKLNNFLSFNTSIGSINNRWGNKLFSFRWNHVFNSKIFSNTTLAYTKYKFSKIIDLKSSDNSEIYFYKLQTGINDLIFKTDFEYNVNVKLSIDFGFNTTFHSFIPAFSEYKFLSENQNIDTVYKNEKVFGVEYNAYFETNYKLSNVIETKVGIRLANYVADNKCFMSVEPRVILLIKINDNNSLKSSYAQTQQNIHLITSGAATLPMDIWATANIKLPPSESKQITLGYYKSFKNNLYELSVETYCKRLTHLVAFKEGATYLSIIGEWTDKLEHNGIGEAKGIEILIEKKYGNTTGWISYTLSKSIRQFENINHGKKYPFKYDRLHSFNVILTEKIKDNIVFTANWVFGSGFPFTLPVARYDIINSLRNDTWLPSNQIIIYADRNTYRMRAYHRLDIAINFIKQKKSRIRTWSINIYNVYNRQNPYFYFSKYNSGTWQIYQQSLFPIIPSISYSLKF